MYYFLLLRKAVSAKKSTVEQRALKAAGTV